MGVTQVEIHAGRIDGPLPRTWHTVVDVDITGGEAALTTAATLGAPMVRLPGLLAGVPGPGGHDYRGVNAAFDRLLAHGLRPVVELSPVPPSLARRQEPLAPPRELDRWLDLVRGLVAQFVGRFGIGEVVRWPFQVWRTTGLASWHGRPAELVELCAQTVRAVKAIDSRLRVGVGGLVVGGEPVPHGTGWLADLLAEVTPDFLALAGEPEPFDLLDLSDRGPTPVRRPPRSDQSLDLSDRGPAPVRRPPRSDQSLDLSDLSDREPALVRRPPDLDRGPALVRRPPDLDRGPIEVWWREPPGRDDVAAAVRLLEACHQVGRDGVVVPRVSGARTPRYWTLAFAARLGPVSVPVSLDGGDARVLAGRRSDGAIGVLLWHPGDPSPVSVRVESAGRRVLHRFTLTPAGPRPEQPLRVDGSVTVELPELGVAYLELVTDRVTP